MECNTFCFFFVAKVVVSFRDFFRNVSNMIKQNWEMMKPYLKNIFFKRGRGETQQLLNKIMAGSKEPPGC